MAPCHLRVHEASVCLTCGDKGETRLLICCRNCRDSVVHHYCMGKLSPDDDNINWLCWDCEPNDTNCNAYAFRKSERIRCKRQKVLENRAYLEEKLNQKKKEVHISNGVSETGGSLTIDVETKLANERQRNQDNLEKATSLPEMASYCEEPSESIKMDEPTFSTNCTLPDKQESSMHSFDENQKIQELGREKTILLPMDSANAQEEAKAIDLQLSSLDGNGHCTGSDISCEQPFLEPVYCHSAEPVIAPIWRGWFNVKQESETCVEILAHISNIACSKASETAIAMPPMLDIQLLDKHEIWPRRFDITPPTASSIALYFFPASERDEKVYDSLLDDVIERELALKVMINGVGLLIFPSCELPLYHWRFNSKYYLWGVFRKKHRSYLSIESATSTPQNHSTRWSPLIQPNWSPLSMRSSHASNMHLSSKHNTPDSLALPYELCNLEKAVEQDSIDEGCRQQTS